MLSVFIGFVLECIFGKPAWVSGPGKWLDIFIARSKNYFTRHFKDSKPTGVFFSIFVLVCVYFCARFLALLGLGSVLIYLAISLKSAKDRLESSDFQAIDTDPEQALRVKIEFIASNTTVDVVGILFYAFLGGPALVWVYKAANASAGAFAAKGSYYKGMNWFGAGLASFLNYFPARICVSLVWLASRFCRLDAKSSIKTAWNEGVQADAISEAAFAGALGVQLGGLDYNDGLAKHKPYVGRQTAPLSSAHLQNAVKLMYVSAIIFLAALIIINYFFNVL